MNTVRLLPLVTFGLAAASCEEATAIECGAGTVLDLVESVCVPAPAPPRYTCGPGTLAVGTSCVPDDRSHFELRLLSPEISADQLQMVPVIAFGTHADGTPVDEPAFITIDRPGAGAFPRPRVELSAMGGVAHYRPCSVSRPGCLGPVRFSLVLLSDPETPVATYDATLVASPTGSSAAPCLSAENIMFFDGEDEIYAGTMAVVDAGWGINGRPDRLRLRVEPNLQGQGRWWRFEFSTEALGVDMTPGLYEHARRPAGMGTGMPRPGLDINGPDGQCSQVDGKFEVHRYEVEDDAVTGALISFEQRCLGAARTLRGCIRVDR